MLCQRSAERQKRMSISVGCNWRCRVWRRKMRSQELLVRCTHVQ
jgi:hypothetical protein